MTKEETRTLGRYHLIAKLGQGGMANVFLTVAPGPAGVQKLLVLKELREELADDVDIHTMFLDEARLAARLNHPNVVQTYEVGEENGHYFIAMEYLEGQPFNRLARKGDREGLPLEAHLRILADALGGLHYAHELTDFDGTPLHVVHRDMSPHNVFVTYDGQVKVVDFGIAKAASSSGSTKNGVFKGKVTYASPEQALGISLDRRSDLFSVGVMLWEALTGKRMWGHKADVAALVALTSGAWVPARQANPAVSPELDAICTRALARNPEDRFGTAAELQHALEDYLERSPVRFSSRQLGQFLTERFHDERSRIRATIDTQIRRLSAAAGGIAAPPVVRILRDDEGDGTPPPLSAPPGAAGTSSETPPGQATDAGQLVGRPASRAKIWIGAGAGVAGALVLALVATHRSAPPADAAASPAALASVAPASGASASAGSTDATVPFRARATPAGAQLFLDGVALGKNPFDTLVPKDGRAHRVRASEPGYASDEEVVSFDGPIDVVLTLKRVSGGSAPPPPRPAPTSDRPQKPKRSLDEQDPYAR